MPRRAEEFGATLVLPGQERSVRVPIDRWELWAGVLILSAVLLFHTAFPRYEFHVVGNESLYLRVDRRTGEVCTRMALDPMGSVEKTVGCR